MPSARDVSERPVLVLGGTGHYGRHIVRSLQRLGAPVRALARDAAGARSLLHHRRLLETFRYTPTTLEMEARERFGGAGNATAPTR